MEIRVFKKRTVMVTCAFQVIDGSVDLLVRDQAYKDSISVVLSGMLRA